MTRALVFRRPRIVKCAGLRVVRCGRCPYAHFVGVHAGPMVGPVADGWWSALGPVGDA